MSVFEDMAAKFEKAASLVPSILDRSIEATEKQLLDLNRSQLIKGKKTDGQSITPKYTKQYKKAAGKKSSTPNLNVSGKFYKSFQANILARTISIKGGYLVSRAHDLGDILEKRYTSEIYGLTERNLARYSKILLPVFNKNLRDELR